LPDPEIIEQDGGMLVTLFKNKYSADQLRKLGLNERQVKAVLYAVENKSITNSQYQQVCNTSERTALRDLEELVAKGVFVKTGLKRGTIYKLDAG